MKVILSPKDTDSKIELDCQYTWQEGSVFCFYLNTGKVRKYPLQHIWYVEFDEKENKVWEVKNEKKRED